MSERRFLIEINEERCKGCGLCIEVCPKNVLESSKKFNSKGYHPSTVKNIESCIGCGFCYQMCPDVCITVKVLEKARS
ncbi:ferredoxin family protein [Petrotoga sp. 9PWA.NaAc.5.4]|uniref:4Fe-4S dicluster domain-containing protein n=1 Tax=Petrotoga sp. 9PWA.NaAc.5.4 TaxID=1434328 RepID=UPI000CAC5403|nr:ferredoxin family protein [Petrotoga sp. 9PWA.NaAc.5.4]PNR93654.1 tungsten formylmethanofuran dehydrogenase subunit G [Petrotoga sp. 9PWA.NaAc.5.4]